MSRWWNPYLKQTEKLGRYLFKLLLALVGGAATLAALWAFHWLIEVASSFSHGGFVVILGVLGLVHEVRTLLDYVLYETGARCRRRKARRKVRPKGGMSGASRGARRHKS
jgi:hypothetical protein